MKPPLFEYHKPTSIPELLELLDTHGHDARILAGGQSLMPSMNFRLSRPEHVIDINLIEELNQLNVEKDKLVVGALTRHVAFEQPVIDDPLGGLLATVCQHLAHWPIRVRGTFAGSLAHADPAAEWCLLVVALDADIIIRSTKGERSVKASEFFKGGFQTALTPNEVIVEIHLPLLGNNARYGFIEVSRRTGDFALAMVLSIMWLNSQDQIERAAVAVGGVQSYPLRVPAAEENLAKGTPSKFLFEGTSEIVAQNLDPMEDIHGDSEFRRDLARTLTVRSLERTLDQ